MEQKWCKHCGYSKDTCVCGPMQGLYYRSRWVFTLRDGQLWNAVHRDFFPRMEKQHPALRYSVFPWDAPLDFGVTLHPPPDIKVR